MGSFFWKADQKLCLQDLVDQNTGPLGPEGREGGVRGFGLVRLIIVVDNLDNSDRCHFPSLVKQLLIWLPIHYYYKYAVYINIAMIIALNKKKNP